MTTSGENETDHDAIRGVHRLGAPSDPCWCGHGSDQHEWDATRDYRELFCWGCK